MDYWDFDCKFGLSEDAAQAVHLANLITCIDHAAKEQAQQVYVEIWAKHGVRTKRPVTEEQAPPAAQNTDAPEEAQD